MIFTQFIRYAGQSLHLFLNSLRSDLHHLTTQLEKEREYRKSHFQSWATTDGQSLLDSENIRFFRIGEGHYRYEFINAYANSFYAFSFSTEDIRVLAATKEYIEIRCLEDQDIRISVTGRITSDDLA